MFSEISVFDLKENYFSAIAKDWMLITAQKPSGEINTMTASWGGIGFIWNKPAFTCVVRPQRYTFEFTESSDIITLSFFGGDQRSALNLCGTKSGRECDKIALSGLHTIKEEKAVYFEEASTVLIGRKAYADYLKKDNFIINGLAPEYYPADDFHMFYICIIEKALKKD